jgi:hypothetical protein
MTTTTKWRSISYAPGEKDHKIVIALLAEERIKFSIFSRNICPKQNAMSMLFLFLCRMGEVHKISIKKRTQHCWSIHQSAITNLQCIPALI